MPDANYLAQLYQQLENRLRGIDPRLLQRTGLRTNPMPKDEEDAANDALDRLQEPDTPGMMPSAPSDASYEWYDPKNDAVLNYIHNPPDELLRTPLPGGGYVKEGTEFGSKIDPFIYGGRKPSNTNEYLNNQGIADEIRKRDLVINRPTQLPPMGSFPGDPGRFRSQFWLRGLGKHSRLAEQALEDAKRRQTPIDVRPPSSLPDMDITGTDFAATPEDIKRRHEQNRSFWERINPFSRISDQSSTDPNAWQTAPKMPPPGTYTDTEGEERTLPNHLRDLPEAVQRSIHLNPSYGEGERLPSSHWTDYDSFAPEIGQRFAPDARRDQPLRNELSFLRQDWQYPLREDQRLAPVEGRYSRPDPNGYPLALY